MLKTIVVHVDGTAGSARRVAVALQLAQRYEAHLIGAAMTGLSAFLFPVSALAVGMPPVVFPVDELRAEADAALATFDQAARQAGLASFESRRIDEESAVGLCLQARYADLVIVSQPDAGAPAPRLRADFTEYVLLHSVRPVLVVPAAGAPVASAAPGARVALGWNGSDAAARAIASALPLLRQASQVELVLFGDTDDGDEPGADLALYLARHGVEVTVSARAGTDDAGQALAAFAAAKQCDLIVMGAFGHTRLREAMLGGATRSVLRAAQVPLWMSH